MANILQQKQIYFRKLSNECYQAIHNLQHITGLNKLYEVKAMHLFLDYSMLTGKNCNCNMAKLTVTALERYFGIPLDNEAAPNKEQGKEVTMLELKPTKVVQVTIQTHAPTKLVFQPFEHKQKTVDIPYIKLNSWALLHKVNIEKR